MTFPALKNFKESEFECKCGRDECDAVPMDTMTLLALQQVRDELKMPMVINSATRCDFWNRAVGGSEKSKHLQGIAVDIGVSNQEKADEIEGISRRYGFNGVGRYDTFIHLDRRDLQAYWDHRSGIPEKSILDE